MNPWDNATQISHNRIRRRGIQEPVTQHDTILMELCLQTLQNIKKVNVPFSPSYGS